MATITVTNLNDDGAGSLRAAINQAAAQAGADEIIFAEALAGQTITLSSRLTLSSGQITINGDTDGDGDTDITISGDANGDGILSAGDTNHFAVTGSAIATLTHLTLENGYQNVSYAANQAAGSIINQGDLTLQDVTIYGVKAVGGANTSISNSKDGASAGAIVNFGDISIADVSIEQSEAYAGDGKNDNSFSPLFTDGGNASTGLLNLAGASATVDRFAVTDGAFKAGDGGDSSTGPNSGQSGAGAPLIANLGTVTLSGEGFLQTFGVSGQFSRDGSINGVPPARSKFPSNSTADIDGGTTSGLISVRNIDSARTSLTNHQSLGTGQAQSIQTFNGDDLISNISVGGFVFAGGGDDAITSYRGQIYGQGGADSLSVLVTSGGDVFFDGGDGFDRIRFSDTVNVSNEAGRQEIGPNAFLTLVNVEALIAGDSDDTLRGGAIAELLQGNTGRDSLSGGEGDDTLSGGGGDDTLQGGDGDDLLIGATLLDNGAISNSGDIGDNISGDDGNDTIIGGYGLDTLFGGDGDDLFSVRGNELLDFFDGGAGVDTLDLSEADADIAFDINLSARTVSRIPAVSIPSITGVENVIGGAGSDLLTGDGLANRLDGGGGNDTISGGGGNDTLNGGDGDDSISTGGGVDFIDGGAGTDTLTVSSSFAESNALFTGGAFLFGAGGNAKTARNVEIFTFQSASSGASETLTAGELTARIADPNPDPGPDPNPDPTPPSPSVPTNGDDSLIGTAQDDTIRALGGDDTVSGLTGDDLLLGGGGNDSIKGAGGDDRLRGNGGNDTLKGGGGADNIKGGGGSDNINGNGGGDTINAGGGADTVKGGGGGDVINGGGGADLLLGGGGADTIAGRAGDDTLRGNGGADIFQFRASDRNDTILDFRQGQDRIEIVSGANSFAALDIQQDGANVLIGFGPGQVRVVTDRANAFDEDDFIF